MNFYLDTRNMSVFCSKNKLDGDDIKSGAIVCIDEDMYKRWDTLGEDIRFIIADARIKHFMNELTDEKEHQALNKNGLITKLEWHKTEDKQPDPKEKVLVCVYTDTTPYEYDVCEYLRDNGWYGTEKAIWFGAEEPSGYDIDGTYWAYLEV